MSEDLMLKCLIAFILGWIVCRMMGEGFSVGADEDSDEHFELLVHFDDTDNVIISLDVTPEDTINEIKLKIQDETGIDKNDQTLFIKRRNVMHLDEYTTIDELDLHEIAYKQLNNIKEIIDITPTRWDGTINYTKIREGTWNNYNDRLIFNNLDPEEHNVKSGAHIIIVEEGHLYEIIKLIDSESEEGRRVTNYNTQGGVLTRNNLDDYGINTDTSLTQDESIHLVVK